MNRLNEKENERVNKLLRGELKTDNPYVEHALESIREKSAEFEIHREQLVQARETVNQIEARLTELDAECASHRRDVITFEGMVAKKGKPSAKGKRGK